MSAFSTELGKNLADQWAKILVLPGLVWMLLLTATLQLGQAHVFDVGALRSQLNRLAQEPAAHAPGTVLLAVAAFTGASAVGGLAADGLGRALQRAWMSAGTSGIGAHLLSVRLRRWKAADDRLRRAVLKAADAQGTRERAEMSRRRTRRATRGLRRTRRRLDRLGGEPARPTRIAECFAETVDRIARVHGLTDFQRAWPRLWAVLPDALRADVTEARDTYAAAARTIGWGLLYAVLAVAWWPSAPLGVAIVLYGASRARPAASELAELIETSVELHASELARQLGLDIAAQGRPESTGQAITKYLAESRANGLDRITGR